MSRPSHDNRSPAGPGGAAATGSGSGDDRFDQLVDRRLLEASRAGDVEAYQLLVRRHRARLYRSALRARRPSDDPEAVMEDLVANLRASLAIFAEASPR